MELRYRLHFILGWSAVKSTLTLLHHATHQGCVCVHIHVRLLVGGED